MPKPTFSSDFEAVYLRHDYLKRVDPSKVNMGEYNKFLKISNITGKQMYEKYQYNFNKVSFSADDVVCVSNAYLYSYLGLYSIKTNPESKTNRLYLNRYCQKYGSYPVGEALEHMERNLLISFLRQKLHHCAEVCSRKARNIVMGKDIRMAVAETQDSKEVPKSSLYPDYKKFGYRKVEKKELKEAKKEAKKKHQEYLEDKDGYKIIEIEILCEGITTDDYAQLFYSEDDHYTNSPEQLLCNQESEIEMDTFKDRFEGLTLEQKQKVLNKFINKYKDNPDYKKEIATARKVLDNCGIINHGE